MASKAFALPITIVNVVGNTHFAIVSLGGITVRGAKANSALRAIQNLMHRLQDVADNDAELALELALAGTSINDQIAVTAGDEQS